jgi:hypothetical protein
MNMDGGDFDSKRARIFRNVEVFTRGFGMSVSFVGKAAIKMPYATNALHQGGRDQHAKRME